jgi:hypothetical protein
MIDDDEEQLAPLSQHVLDMVPPDIHKLFRDILKYRVDAVGEYYGITADTLIQSIHGLSQDTVAAIATEPGDFKYKEKGHMYDPILQSFVQGAGGRISNWEKEENNMTPVVLRGITKRKEMVACRDAGRDFYYIDTGYFGNGKKKTFHRITKNDVQNFGSIIDRPGDRLAATGVTFRKFKSFGSKILLAPPSQKLLNLYNIRLDNWLEATINQIGVYTDREIVIRLKQGRSTRLTTDTMESALQNDIFCLVTFSSIAAGEAILCGKPAITLGPNAAASLCSQSVIDIENPKIPTMDEVVAWARHMSYCQFTEPEMKDGTAWRILNDN